MFEVWTTTESGNLNEMVADYHDCFTAIYFASGYCCGSASIRVVILTTAIREQLQQQQVEA